MEATPAIFRQGFSGWSKEQHARAAEEMATRARHVGRLYNEAVTAALKRYGDHGPLTSPPRKPFGLDDLPRRRAIRVGGRPAPPVAGPRPGELSFPIPDVAPSALDRSEVDHQRACGRFDLGNLTDAARARNDVAARERDVDRDIGLRLDIEHKLPGHSFG